MTFVSFPLKTETERETASLQRDLKKPCGATGRAGAENPRPRPRPASVERQGLFREKNLGNDCIFRFAFAHAKAFPIWDLRGHVVGAFFRVVYRPAWVGSALLRLHPNPSCFALYSVLAMISSDASRLPFAGREGLHGVPLPFPRRPWLLRDSLRCSHFLDRAITLQVVFGALVLLLYWHWDGYITFFFCLNSLDTMDLGESRITRKSRVTSLIIIIHIFAGKLCFFFFLPWPWIPRWAALFFCVPS